MKFSRIFAMPNHETFSIKPIGEFVNRWRNEIKGIGIDPFARNKKLVEYTNDLDPNTSAEYHLDAEEFCNNFLWHSTKFNFALFDPPYSPRQIAECYKEFGREVTKEDTQNAVMYNRVRDALHKILLPNAVVLSFGWSSNGMGKIRGYEIEEILLVAHGGAHNDTICIAERKL